MLESDRSRYLLATDSELSSKHPMPPEDPQPASLPSLLTPEGLVRVATKAHPAFKYAIVVGGIAALVAIVSRFGVSGPTLVLGVIIGLFFMFIFLIFSIATRAKGSEFGHVALLLVWALAILFVAILCLLLTSSFFDAPIKIRTYLEKTITGVHAGYSDEDINQLREDVRKLREETGGKTDAIEVQREAELRKEEPDRFRTGEVYWPIGATLRLRFLDGDKTLQDRVLSIAQEWTKYANIQFSRSSANDADVRISFKTQGEWSAMGTQCLAIPKNEPTTGLGGLDFSDEDQSRYFILHVFGHVLGLIHEHQSPGAHLDFDWDKAYRYYGGPPMQWSKEQVDDSLRPVEKADVAYANKPFDPHSVMLYPFPGEIMVSGRNIERGGSKLSQEDIALIRRIYPGR